MDYISGKDPLGERPDFKITNRDSARRWIMELVHDVKVARLACNVTPVSAKLITVGEQKRAERIWLVKHGGALGSLMALYRVGLLDDVAYTELRKEVMATLIPTVIQ